MQELIFPQLQYNLLQRCPFIMILMDVHSIDLPTLYELIDFTLCDGTRLNVVEHNYWNRLHYLWHSPPQ